MQPLARKTGGFPQVKRQSRSFRLRDSVNLTAVGGDPAERRSRARASPEDLANTGCGTRLSRTMAKMTSQKRPNSDNLPARARLIVALDLPTADRASSMAEKLIGRVGMFKIGSELFGVEGPVLARNLTARGEGVFLDLKFHDIPNTVRGAAREAARLGVRMFNVHASGGRKMMEAAHEGALEGWSGQVGGKPPLVLAVTVLTSLGSEDLREIGLTGTPQEAAVRLALLAQSSGLDGVVASAQEAFIIRQVCGPGFVIVTPGIRPASSEANDQARISTPADAVQAGADYLVAGRPITSAREPESAADAIVAEIDRALPSVPTAQPSGASPHPLSPLPAGEGGPRSGG
jgi:orotidine-5'-phosphate decarboxylase